MQNNQPSQELNPSPQGQENTGPDQNDTEVQLLKPGTPEVRFGTGKKQGKDGCGY